MSTTLSQRNDLVKTQVDMLVDGIKEREKELTKMRLQQIENDEMSAMYDKQIKEMTQRIAQLEAVAVVRDYDG